MSKCYQQYQKMKCFFKYFCLIAISLACSSANFTELSIELTLVDEGWNKHFKSQTHNHSDIGKFRDNVNGQLILVEFNLPNEFDKSKLIKDNKFRVTIYPSVDMGNNLNIKRKKDLKKYKVYNMSNIKPL